MAATTVSDEQWEQFHAVVNMTSRELREWLAIDTNDAALSPTEPPETDAGAPADPDDRELGRRVLAVLAKRRTDLTPDDVAAMGHAVGRIESLRAEVGDEPLAADDRRRHRLMSLGHDLLKPT